MADMDNQINQVVERIARLDPVESSLEHWKFDGEEEKDGQQTKEYFGEFCTPDQIAGLQALATAYLKLRACVEHYAAQKDRTVRCGACGFENHRRANRDRAQQTLDEIGKD